MNFTNMFGCVEMERAAENIYGETEVSIDDFTEDHDLLVGFVLLAAHGWIKPDSPNGTFLPGEDFTNRIKKLLPIEVERRHLVQE